MKGGRARGTRLSWRRGPARSRPAPPGTGPTPCPRVWSALQPLRVWDEPAPPAVFPSPRGSARLRPCLIPSCPCKSSQAAARASPKLQGHSQNNGACFQRPGQVPARPGLSRCCLPLTVTAETFLLRGKAGLVRAGLQLHCSPCSGVTRVSSRFHRTPEPPPSPGSCGTTPPASAVLTPTGNNGNRCRYIGFVQCQLRGTTMPLQPPPAPLSRRVKPFSKRARLGWDCNVEHQLRELNGYFEAGQDKSISSSFPRELLALHGFQSTGGKALSLFLGGLSRVRAPKGSEHSNTPGPV